MKRVRYNGKIYSVPDEATDEQISAFVLGQNHPAAPAPEPKGGFFSGLYDTTIGPLVGMANGAIQQGRQLQQDFNAAPGLLDKAGVLGRGIVDSTPGVQAARGILSNASNQLGQARDLYRQGDTAGAVGRVGAAVPIVGPLADQVTDAAITEDNLPKAAGQVTGILASALAPKIAAGAKPLLQRGADSLRKGAAARIEKVLNPTTKGNKIRTEQITPGLLDRRFTANSLDDFAKKATEAKEAAGAAIGDAFDALPAETTVPLDPILKTFAQKAVDKFTVRGADGTLTAPNPQAAKALNAAGDIAKRMNAVSENGVITVEALRKFKQSFDDIGRQAGRFDGVSLADQSAAAVQSIAADASRNALNSQFPQIAALNKEFGFWKDVERVATDTVLRRRGQAPSLLTDIAKGAGTVAGGAHGGIEGALAARAALGALSGARRNPLIQTRLAANQARLADRIANFNPAPVGILGPVGLAQQGLLYQDGR